MEDIKINDELTLTTESGEVNSDVILKNSAEPKRSGFVRFLRGLLIILSLIILIPSLVLFSLYVIPGIQEFGKGRNRVEVNDVEFKQLPTYKKQIALLERDLQKATKKLNAFTPTQPYIVISTTNNRFFLYQNKKMIREGFCSSGSYIMLLTDGPKKWVFKTPKGMFKINSKRTDPIWVKPDWAFVEEGLPVPSARADSRYEYGVLGDYALDIGNDYMIHGTIWKRFLGMPATHGCIRLNDDDLKLVYKTLGFGSKVYIY